MAIWRGVLAAAFLLLASMTAVSAAEYVDNPPPLIDRLTPEVLALVFPGAGRLETVEGPPTAVAAYTTAEDGTEALGGYIYSTLDLLAARGYTSTPFDVLAGIDADGVITGSTIVFNPEPHISGDDRRTELLMSYFQSLVGIRYNNLATEARKPDFVSGATISARAMRYAIADGARLVMRGLLGAPVVTEPTLDVDVFTERTRDELLEDGSIRSLVLTNADVEAALVEGGHADITLDTAIRGEPGEVYIEFFVGLGTPPTISRSLVNSQGLLDRFTAEQPEGAQQIILGSSGRYNFQGVSYMNESTGHLFDRVEIIQGETTFVLHGDQYTRAPNSLGIYGGMIALAPDSGFDPLAPWTAVLKVNGSDANGERVSVTFPVEYELPPLYVLMPEPEPEPAWVATWRDATPQLVVLGIALFILTLIFVFQSRLARYRRAHRWVRNGFLLFTLVWIGYIAGGQLSIVHVINYLKAPFEGADITFYLTEPLIFILAVYVLISLILIGRGVFCGWLCPFGALQELSHRVGRFLRLPEWNPSPKAQRWMWLPKYGVAAAVIGTAFVIPQWAIAAEEVEPFKTAITSAFTRPWPYVTYAGLLLLMGLFTERFFCRFLCPLGATLAVLDRLHLVTLLKRRPQCGSPCHLCESSCPVKAIKPTGQIVNSECFQCLDCQVEYYDDRRCPPLARERKLRERSVVQQPIGQPLPAFAASSLS